MNIIGNRKIFLGISFAFVAAAVLLILLFGFREGIDFKGGTLWRIRVEESGASLEHFEQFLHDNLHVDARVSRDTSSQSFLVRLSSLSEEEHARFAKKIKEAYPSFQELSFESIGPSIGAELRSRAELAVVLVLVGISLYIAFAFRKVYKPVSSWKYGWITLVTLFHDVAIPAGLLALLGKYGTVEIDGNFIVAILVVMGFSVHDTIVVFDRIRENLSVDRGKSEFDAIVNKSVNQTLARSINTSFTLILVLVALLVAGPLSLRYFVLTLLVGVTTGVYSSIFVASPLLYVWHSFSKRRILRR